jgi:S1-C subfamily serine protease
MLRRFIRTLLVLALLAGGAYAATVAVGSATSGGGSTAHATPAQVTRVASRSPTAGVVVIDTALRFQGGQAAGTGMVLTPSGDVVTNNHVIAGATTIRVIVPQTGHSYTATVTGYSVSADTALLKLRNASGLTAVATGNSSRVVRGQLVRAVGNARGAGVLSIVRGRVTQLGQSITASGDQGGGVQLSSLIESNVALQPGDSGGPLLNRAGRVVGMNAAKSVAGGGFSFRTAPNQAFSIPINRVLGVVRQIQAGRSSSTVHIGGTAFLGVDVANRGAGSGTFVSGVVPGSGADHAGLQPGDQLIALDGRQITSADGLVSMLLGHKPGETVTLTWIGVDGAQHSAAVVLAGGPPQ